MSNEHDDSALFNISPEEMTSILCEAAEKKRTVVEFQTRKRDDGRRELYQAVEITDHVEALEESE
jgi:hypothetical protein